MKEKKRGGGNPGDQGKVDYLLKKLSETDRVVESKTGRQGHDQLHDAARGPHHHRGLRYRRGGRRSREEELVAKRSLYLYHGLLDGARFNGKILGKMAAVLERDGD